MFYLSNRTVFDIPLTWNRTHFASTRTKCRHSRKLIEISINVQLEKQLKHVCLQNRTIEKVIAETNDNLLKHEKKVHIFDNLTEIASQSLSNHFDKRMENVRTIIKEHCYAIGKVLQQENQYWREIHSAIDQKSITTNDLRTIEKSPELFDDNSPTPTEINPPLVTIQEYSNVGLPSRKSNQLSSSTNTTYTPSLHVPSREMSASLLYSEPNLPARLDFSPTILQHEETESIRQILSPLNQNKTNECLDLLEPKVLIKRVSERFLREHLKMNHLHIQSKNNSNHYYQYNSIRPFDFKEFFCRNSPESTSTSSLHSLTENNIERIPQAKTENYKQSEVEENDTTRNTIALRKRKSAPNFEVEEQKPKRKKTNKKQMPIRESSSLPTINRSKYNSTRFSTRSHRVNNLTLTIIDTDSDNDHHRSKSCSRLRKR